MATPREAEMQFVGALATEQARALALREAREESNGRGAAVFSETAEAIRKSGKSRGISRITTPVSLALKHRERIKEGDFSVFFVPFVFALAKDGLLDLIPIIGTVAGSFITIYLFIFLWGKGTLKWKIVRSLLLFLDLFAPFVKIIPFTTFCVAITYVHARKEAERSKEELRQTEKVFA